MISFAASDNDQGSPVVSLEFSVNDGAFQPHSAPLIVSTQGTTRITARATDAAANVETAPSPIVVRIDSSAAVVTITSPEPRDYQHADNMIVSFSAADSVSGVQSVSAALDGGAVQNAQTMSLLTLALGVHTLDVSASDVAGNSVRQSVSFRVVATIDSLIASVNIDAEQGTLDASNQRSLLAKLYDAKAALDRGNTSSAAAKLRDFIDQCSRALAMRVIETEKRHSEDSLTEPANRYPRRGTVSM